MIRKMLIHRITITRQEGSWMRRIVSLLVAFIMVFSAFVILDANFNSFISYAKGDTLYVNITGSDGAYTSIQDAINMANSGDTIFVYSGIYNESAQPIKGIFIDKAITLLGEDKETTIINVPSKTFGVHIKNVEYVNISGFTVMGSSSYNFLLSSSNYSKIHDNIVKNSGATAVGISSSSFNTIENNDLADNLHGISISDNSRDNIVRNNMIESITNADRAIILQSNAHENIVEDNTIEGYNVGVYVYQAEDNEVENNHISEGIEGIRIVEVADILISNNIITNNDYGIKLVSSSASVFNCSIEESKIYDLWIEDPDALSPEIYLLNTTFDEAKVEISDVGPTLTVKFFLHVTVVDELNQPIGGILVKPKDNADGLLSGNYITDSNGVVNYILLPYFVENFTTKTEFTPFNISASTTISSGFTHTDAVLSQSISITVKLFTDTDGDGILDADDSFPEDPNEWMDTDLDGVGDNGDAFPNDPNEQTDTDSDGVGNNGDDFPSDSAASVDSDGDGYPESWNTNKSKADSTTGLELDEFPNDSSEWKDSDSDGIGDNSDFLPSLHNTVFILIIVVIIVIIIILTIVMSRRGRKPIKWDDEKKGDDETTDEIKED
jgi:parallel beta-helix repeat protein